MNDFLMYVMAAAVVVSAVAIVIQVIILARIGKAAKAIDEQTREFMAKARPVLDQAAVTIQQTQTQISEVSRKANDVLDLAHKQLVTVDGMLADVSARAKVQLDRAEMVIDDAMGRVQETVNVVQYGVLKPVREVSALVSGLRAGLTQFLRRNRTTVERATHDEEMFIG